MADVEDVSLVIASALSEISMAGSLDVVVDDNQKVSAMVGGNDDVEVTVVVKRIEHAGPVAPHLR
jgi:hypothetical protein